MSNKLFLLGICSWVVGVIASIVLLTVHVSQPVFLILAVIGAIGITITITIAVAKWSYESSTEGGLVASNEEIKEVKTNNSEKYYTFSDRVTADNLFSIGLACTDAIYKNANSDDDPCDDLIKVQDIIKNKEIASNQKMSLLKEVKISEESFNMLVVWLGTRELFRELDASLTEKVGIGFPDDVFALSNSVGVTYPVGSPEDQESQREFNLELIKDSLKLSS